MVGLVESRQVVGFHWLAPQLREDQGRCRAGGPLRMEVICGSFLFQEAAVADIGTMKGHLKPGNQMEKWGLNSPTHDVRQSRAATLHAAELTGG